MSTMSTITIFSHSVKYEWGRTDSSNVVTRLRLIYKAWKLWLVKREWKRVGEKEKAKVWMRDHRWKYKKEESQRRWWKAWASKLERQRRQCLWAVGGGDEFVSQLSRPAPIVLVLSDFPPLPLSLSSSPSFKILPKPGAQSSLMTASSHRVTLSQSGLCMYDICKDMVRM